MLCCDLNTSSTTVIPTYYIIIYINLTLFAVLKWFKVGVFLMFITNEPLLLLLYWVLDVEISKSGQIKQNLHAWLNTTRGKMGFCFFFKCFLWTDPSLYQCWLKHQVSWDLIKLVCAKNHNIIQLILLLMNKNNEIIMYMPAV